MALFTAENAATMAQRRWQAERERKANPRILAAPFEANAEQTPQQSELARTREHIELINQQLDSCSDPDEWDCLTRSKERLFRIWARLAQLPTDPKPTTSKPRRTEPMPEPTPAIPQVVAAPAQAEPKPSQST